MFSDYTDFGEGGLDITGRLPPDTPRKPPRGISVSVASPAITSIGSTARTSSAKALTVPTTTTASRTTTTSRAAARTAGRTTTRAAASAYLTAYAAQQQTLPKGYEERATEMIPELAEGDPTQATEAEAAWLVFHAILESEGIAPTQAECKSVLFAAADAGVFSEDLEVEPFTEAASEVAQEWLSSAAFADEDPEPNRVAYGWFRVQLERPDWHNGLLYPSPERPKLQASAFWLPGFVAHLERLIAAAKGLERYTPGSVASGSSPNWAYLESLIKDLDALALAADQSNSAVWPGISSAKYTWQGHSVPLYELFRARRSTADSLAAFVMLAAHLATVQGQGDAEESAELAFWIDTTDGPAPQGVKFATAALFTLIKLAFTDGLGSLMMAGATPVVTIRIPQSSSAEDALEKIRSANSEWGLPSLRYRLLSPDESDRLRPVGFDNFVLSELMRDVLDAWARQTLLPDSAILATAAALNNATGASISSGEILFLTPSDVVFLSLHPEDSDWVSPLRSRASEPDALQEALQLGYSLADHSASELSSFEQDEQSSTEGSFERLNA